MAILKLATYNVNGINARLPVLVRWLAEEKPDIACLQELKAPQEKFPEDTSLWVRCYLARSKKLERCGNTFPCRSAC